MDSHIPPPTDLVEDPGPRQIRPDLLSPTAHRGASPAGARRRAHAAVAAEREHAFRSLFREEMFQSVRRWLRKLGVAREDLDDLIQIVMMEALRSFPSYDLQRGRPDRWLNRIAVHVTSHYHQRSRCRRKLLVSADETHEAVPDGQPSPEQALCDEETRRDLHVALQTVRPSLRWVLREHDLDEVRIAELARTRGISLSTAYKWRASALAALRAAVVERGTAD